MDFFNVVNFLTATNFLTFALMQQLTR